jgi:translation initiation factor 2-alpha kinase 4
MQKSEDRSIYDKVLNAIFDEEMLSTKYIHQVGRLGSVGDSSSSIQHTDLVTEVRDYVVEVNKEIFRQHCAKHLEISPVQLLDDCPQFNRLVSTFKFFTSLRFNSWWT